MTQYLNLYSWLFWPAVRQRKKTKKNWKKKNLESGEKMVKRGNPLKRKKRKGEMGKKIKAEAHQ